MAISSNTSTYEGLHESVVIIILLINMPRSKNESSFYMDDSFLYN